MDSEDPDVPGVVGMLVKELLEARQQGYIERPCFGKKKIYFCVCVCVCVDTNVKVHVEVREQFVDFCLACMIPTQQGIKLRKVGREGGGGGRAHTSDPSTGARSRRRLRVSSSVASYAGQTRLQRLC
jgi:hypothetical protein